MNGLTIGLVERERDRVRVRAVGGQVRGHRDLAVGPDRQLGRTQMDRARIERRLVGRRPRWDIDGRLACPVRILRQGHAPAGNGAALRDLACRPAERHRGRDVQRRESDVAEHGVVVPGRLGLPLDRKVAAHRELHCGQATRIHRNLEPAILTCDDLSVLRVVQHRDNHAGDGSPSRSAYDMAAHVPDQGGICGAWNGPIGEVGVWGLPVRYAGLRCAGFGYARFGW